MLGLYVHIPFCAAICNYCNFNRGLFDASLKDRYLTALDREIERRADGAPADTIFFGGGTPSLLEPDDVRRILTSLAAAFDVVPGTEVTLEANPETITAERLDGYRRAGVNRLSFGVQSFRDDELQRLTRLHSAGRAVEAVRAARAAGFDNLSLDLMMWLPQQSLAQWMESVEALIDVGPEHASLYLLEVYPNAPLRDTMARARWSQAPDDDAAAMYVTAMERLERAGFDQYEISNVARPGRQSRHNVKYWEDGEWLGLGCGAHSTRGGVRWKNVASTTEYISAAMTGGSLDAERRTMAPAERAEDALFTGLRLSKGLDLAAVHERYGVDVWGEYGSELEPFIEGGLLIYDGRGLRLTRAGMLLAHEVMAVFIRSTVR